jgi:HK97 family phage major capsid protein
MNAKQLREKRGALVEQMQGMVAAAKAEGRNLSQEENEKFDAISNEVDELRSAAARIERAEELKKEMANKAEEVREAAPAKKVEAREAFNAYLRKGFNNLSAEERSIMGELRGTNTQITTNDGLGGFLVPENWAAAVSATELFKSDIEKVATIISTSNGQPFNLPANNDTSVAAAILGEGTAESVSDMTFTNVKFEPYTYSSKIVKVSRQLVSDNAFDLGSFVAGQLANRLNRGINGHLTTGTGSSQPSGIVTGSSLGKTAASASAVTIAEILDLMYSVDASYRNSAGAAFMMNSATLAAVRKLGFGSSNDFPVFVPAMEVGGVDLLFGKPVYVNEDMAGIATGNKSIIFGDMKQYYIHQAGGVQLLRLEERYADELSVGYIAYRRLDGNVVQGSAIKHLVQA